MVMSRCDDSDGCDGLCDESDDGCDELGGDGCDDGLCDELGGDGCDELGDDGLFDELGGDGCDELGDDGCDELGDDGLCDELCDDGLCDDAGATLWVSTGTGGRFRFRLKRFLNLLVAFLAVVVIDFLL
jgi:hypothetical protein